MFFNLLLSTIIGLLAVYQSPAVETEDPCESFFRAAKTGDLPLLKECFENDPHIASRLNECIDEQGNSILSTAVAHHQTEIASKIVNHKDFKLKKNRQYDLKNHHERVWPKTDKRIAIKGSNAVPLKHFEQAASIVEEMLEGRPDILSILNQEDNYILIHDDILPWDKAPDREGEFTLPWDDDRAGEMSPKRGYIMVRQKYLETSSDWLLQQILVHEIAHAIHLVALDDLDPSFDQKLKDLYDVAMGKGLWKHHYASTDHYEYWAEGVAYFFHLENNSVLKDYDEKLFDLIDSIFIRKRLTADLLQFYCGEPPLIRALNIQDTDVMLDVMNEILAMNETDVNQPSSIYMGCHPDEIYSPIVRALQLNEIEAFKLLLQHPNIDLNERNGRNNVLFCAIATIKDDKTFLQILSMLLDHPKMDWSWMPKDRFEEFKNFV